MINLLKIVLILFSLFQISFAQWVPTNQNYNFRCNLLAASGSSIFAATGGISRSTNNGQNWIFSFAPKDGEIHAIAATTTDVFAAFSDYNAGWDSGIIRSTDQGQSWITVLPVNYLAPVIALYINGQIIFAGAQRSIGWSGPGRLFRSVNNGESWATVLVMDNISFTSVISIGSNVFAGTSSIGILRSTDNGMSWAQTSMNNRSVKSLAIAGDKIFAGTDTFGVYRSTDNGNSWFQTSLNNVTIRSLAVSGSNIFAGTQQYGVYLTTNDGLTWTQRNEGIGNRSVNSLVITTDFIFAGTDSSWVWRRPLSELVGVSSTGIQTPKEFGLHQNYPNPFNPKTNIKFQIPKNEFVKLTIFDILGREIAVLVNEELKAGTYEADWNGSNFSSGVYYYTLNTGDYSETKKMILIK